MEKLKFGIPVFVLLLSFPVLFLTEIEQGEKENKKASVDEVKIIAVKNHGIPGELKKQAGDLSFALLPFSKFMTVNN